MASRRSALATARSVSDAASWYLALALVAVVVVSTLREGSAMANLAVVDEDAASGGGRLVARPCDEIYVVGEGETLHTISDKCGDPFILERNPHIDDPDDVFPGLIIKITPSTNPK